MELQQLSLRECVGWVRQGAVYGLAGALIAGDAASSFARGAVSGSQRAASTTDGVLQDAARRARQGRETSPESNREDVRSIIRESVRRSGSPQ